MSNTNTVSKKIEISKKQVDLYFAIISRLSRVANEQEQRDLAILENIADQWLRKFGQLSTKCEIAEQKLELVKDPA